MAPTTLAISPVATGPRSRRRRHRAVRPLQTAPGPRQICAGHSGAQAGRFGV